MTTQTLKHAIVVHIANANSPLFDGEKSVAGHMWFTLVDDFGNRQSYGFAPEEGGRLDGVGKIYLTDDEHYLKHTDYEREISSEQFNDISEFIRSTQQQVESGHGRWSHYNGLYNSCIDFTWQALHRAGLTDSPENGWQGNLLPYLNNWFLKREFLVKDTEGAIHDRVNELFRQSGATRFFYYDPLVLDLDGDGIDTVGRDKGIFFDGDNDGIKTNTGWVAADDGLLVMDRNGNGVIDNGAELFGDSTLLGNHQHAADGFAALADQDSNHDRKIDHQDINWDRLHVWRDLNQDGASQADELFSLAQLEITSLDLPDASQYYSPTLSHGNQLAEASRFTRSNGRPGIMRDVNFADGLFRRVFTTPLALSDAIKSLPNMQGSGKVRDLREAASLSQPLQELLVQYQAAGSRQQQRALLDPMLSLWADTAGMSKTLKDQTGNQYQVAWQTHDNRTIANTPAERAVVAAWEKKLHILEAFNGQHYFSMEKFTSRNFIRFTKTESVGGQHGAIEISLLRDTQIYAINAGYRALQDSIYTGLLLQTRYQGLMNEVSLKLTSTGVELDFSNIEQHFAKEIEKNPLEGISKLLEFNCSAGRFFPNFHWLAADLLSENIAKLRGSDRKDLFIEFDLRCDGSTIYIEDYILGGSGNDLIWGSQGDDIIIGGAGNDTLKGGDGNNTYIFNIGDGEDIIEDYNERLKNTDTLQFGSGISPDSIRLERVGHDLVLIVNASDKVTIKNCLHSYFTYEFMVETIAFADGTTWDHLDFRHNTVTTGTAGDDTLTGLAHFRNQLQGGAGNDIIIGGDANDILVGDTGNDTLRGGTGDDTYVFRHGDGIDIIFDHDRNANNTDTLAFDVDSEQLWLRHVDDDLEVRIIGSTDKVSIQNWYAGSAYQVEKIQANNNQILLHTDVDKLVDAMAAFAPPAAGQLFLPPDYQTTIRPVIASSWH